MTPKQSCIALEALVRLYVMKNCDWCGVYLCPYCRKTNVIVKDFMVEHGSIVYPYYRR
jgi:hypothetical protein